MLKYKMTVPHVQLKISKNVLFCFNSLSFCCLSVFGCVLRYAERNASYLGSCLCARIFSVKRKKKTLFFPLPQISRLSGVWWLNSSAACQLAHTLYRNASLSLSFSFSLLSLSLVSLRAEEINHVWEQVCPILGSNLTSEECH